MVEGIDRHLRNPVFLRGHSLPATVAASSSLPETVAGADVVMVAVPSRFYRAALRVAATAVPAGSVVVSLTKELERETLLRMTQVAASELHGHLRELIGVLSGPNIAREVIAGSQRRRWWASPTSAWRRGSGAAAPSESSSDRVGRSMRSWPA